MLRYILGRLLVMIPTLILISMLVFTIIELPPGDYFESYVAEMRAMGETANLAEIEELRTRYGFDQPAPVRYFRWAGGMLTGGAYAYCFANSALSSIHLCGSAILAATSFTERLAIPSLLSASNTAP